MSCICTPTEARETYDGCTVRPIELPEPLCPAHGVLAPDHGLPVLAAALSAAAAGERQLSADELRSAADAVRLLSGMISA